MKINRKPRIEMAGGDIAPYVYGTTTRIFIPDRSRANVEHLRIIKRAIERFSRDATLHGVKLGVIKNVNELHVGDRIQHLFLHGQVISKSIVRISGFSTKEGCTYVQTETLTKGEEGFNGFFEASCLDFDSPNADPYYSGLYLKYEGKAIEEVDASPKPKSFFETIEEFARDHKTLVECWSMAFEPSLRDDEHWSHDPYDSYWLREFGRIHGNKFQHQAVGLHLSYVLELGELQGINRIYEDRPHRWEKKDLISPLLEQMQTDILEKMFEDPSLADLFFGSNTSQYWRNRLRVIFEMYYGPKGMVHQPRQDDFSPSNAFNSKTHKRLQVLAGIIETSHHEGEREEAMRVYEKMAGRPYRKVGVVIEM